MRLKTPDVSYVYVLGTVLLTVYGQLVVKWQVDKAGSLPAGVSGKVDFFGRLLLNPWVISVLAAAFVAALLWMAAVSHLELSRAYPFVGLTFVFVLTFSRVLFDEPLSVTKVAGVGLILVGIGVASQ